MQVFILPVHDANDITCPTPQPRRGLRFLLILLISLVANSAIAAQRLPEEVLLARTENEPLNDLAFHILEEAYGRLGTKVIGVLVPAERALLMVNSGDAFGDVIHIDGLESAYPNLIPIPVPLMSADALVFAADRRLTPTNWASLAKYQLCIRRGIKSIELAVEAQPTVVVVNQYESIFKMLKAGRCNVAVLPSHAWLEAQRLQVTGLHSADRPLQSWPLYHYVHKSHSAIIPQLETQLRTLHDDGFIANKQAEFYNHLEAARRASGGYN